MVRFVPLCASLLASLAAPVSAAETRLALDYDFRVGPLRVVQMKTTVDLTDATYRAQTDMRTVGITGFFFPWTATAVSSGTRGENHFQPQQHHTQGTFRGEKRSVEIDYSEGGRVSARSEPPPDEDWRDAVPTDLQQGTIDPLSATLAALQSGCAGTLRVFDGRRRYDLRFQDLGEDTLANSSDQLYAGPAHRCRAEIDTLAGFRSDHRISETPTALDFWIASPRPGTPPLPVYLELSGTAGTLRIRLTAVRDVTD